MQGLQTANIEMGKHRFIMLTISPLGLQSCFVPFPGLETYAYGYKILADQPITPTYRQSEDSKLLTGLRTFITDEGNPLFISVSAWKSEDKCNENAEKALVMMRSEYPEVSFLPYGCKLGIRDKSNVQYD